MTAGPRAADTTSMKYPLFAMKAGVLGLAEGREVIWAPPLLKFPFAVLRMLPRRVWRRVAERAAG